MSLDNEHNQVNKVLGKMRKNHTLEMSINNLNFNALILIYYKYLATFNIAFSDQKKASQNTKA
jgi:hypothetical protein